MISTTISDQIEINNNIIIENKNTNTNGESGTIVCDETKTNSNEIITDEEIKSGVEKNDVEVVIMKEEKEDDVVIDVKSEVTKDVKEEIKEEKKYDNNDNNDDGDDYNENNDNANENDITGDNSLNFLLASVNDSLLENENESDKSKANKRKDISALQSMISGLPSSASLLLLREADGGQNGPGPDPSPRSSHAPQVI